MVKPGDTLLGAVGSDGGIGVDSEVAAAAPREGSVGSAAEVTEALGFVFDALPRRVFGLALPLRLRLFKPVTTNGSTSLRVTPGLPIKYNRLNR